VRTTRLLARALAAGWDIPPELRDTITARLRMVIEDGESSPREVTAASKALMDALRLEQSAVDVALRARSQEELAERVAEIEARLKQGGGHGA
jgi:hypothetical protein